MKGAASATLINASSTSQSASKSKLPLPARIKGGSSSSSSSSSKGGPLFFEENEFKTLQIVRTVPALLTHYRMKRR